MTVTAWTLIETAAPVSTWTLLGDDGTLAAIANETGVDSIVALVGPAGATGNALVESYAQLAEGDDCRLALQTALLANERVHFTGTAYDLSGMPAADSATSNDFGASPQPCFSVPATVREIDGRGVTLTITEASKRIMLAGLNWPNGQVGSADANDTENWDASDLTADVAAGAFTRTVADGTKFAAGDWVVDQLGEVYFDTPETYNWRFARVVSVAGNVVTLDAACPEDWTLASVTGDKKRLLKIPTQYAYPFAFRNFNLIATEALEADQGLICTYRRNVLFENIVGHFMGAGLIQLQYVDGGIIRNCDLANGDDDNASWSVAYAFTEARGITLQNCRARGVKYGIKAEFDCDIWVEGFHFSGTFPYDGTTPASNTMTVVQCTTRSRVNMHNTVVSNCQGVNLGNTSVGISGHGGWISWTGTTYVTGSASPYLIPFRGFSGTLHCNIAGTRNIYDTSKARWITWTIPLTDGDDIVECGPSGIILDMRIRPSSGLTLGTGNKVSNVRVERESSGGTIRSCNNLTTTGYENGGTLSTAGQFTDFAVVGGTAAGNNWTYRDEKIRVRVVTSGTGTPIAGTGQFIEVQLLVCSDEQALNFTIGDDDKG